MAGNEQELAELNRALRSVEERYLNVPDYSQNRGQELVNRFREQVIDRELSDLVRHVEYAGGSYEISGVPELSDYDLQLYLKIPHAERILEVEEVEESEWRRLKGGLKKCQTSDGYFSALKARTLIQSRLDKLIATSQTLEFEVIKRATHGPAISLELRGKYSQYGTAVSVDLVVCVRSKDIPKSYGDGGHEHSYDLTAKPKAPSEPASLEDYWRLSYSLQEKKLLNDLHRAHSRKTTLYKIVKVIRNYCPQLACLPNYFYKNVIFFINEEFNDYQYWGNRPSLGQRFKSFIGLVHKALCDHNQPMYFNSKVNLLKTKDPGQLDSTKGYLGWIISKGKYIDLVKHCPPRTGYAMNDANEEPDIAYTFSGLSMRVVSDSSIHQSYQNQPQREKVEEEQGYSWGSIALGVAGAAALFGLGALAVAEAEKDKKK